MNLFISSSNNFIFKSLITFLLLSSIYTLWILFFNPSVTTFQNQWVENYATAQEYIYNNNDKKYNIVIVGSSMANRLIEKKLDDEIYNLSFAGSGVITCLNILIKSDKIPKKVLIESNIIERRIDKEMIDRLFTPIVWKIKKYIPLLQEKYKPINIFLSYIFEVLGKTKKDTYRPKPNNEIFEKLLINNIDSNSVSKNFLNNEEINELKKLIKYLQARGVQIIFFRMPVDQKVANTHSYSERAIFLNKQFNGLLFMPMPVDQNYETSDGIHLTYQGAQKFSTTLNKWIKNI